MENIPTIKIKGRKNPYARTGGKVVIYDDVRGKLASQILIKTISIDINNIIH